MDQSHTEKERGIADRFAQRFEAALKQLADGRTMHVRKAIRSEPRQQRIDDALGVSDRAGQQQVAVV